MTSKDVITGGFGTGAKAIRAAITEDILRLKELPLYENAQVCYYRHLAEGAKRKLWQGQ